MQEEIVKTTRGLLTLLEKYHEPSQKIKVIDEQMEMLAMLVQRIQSNWIPVPDRLARALKRKEELDAEIKLLKRR